MKVFVDITFAALIFFFFGFALIYRKDADRLIGRPALGWKEI
ncbi:hypothetical protein [Paenibacillus elgii]|nr:hypothetical protein [Paenibacillus elgii]